MSNEELFQLYRKAEESGTPFSSVEAELVAKRQAADPVQVQPAQDATKAAQSYIQRKLAAVKRGSGDGP